MGPISNPTSLQCSAKAFSVAGLRSEEATHEAELLASYRKHLPLPI